MITHSVLLVDDDKDFLDAIRATFEKSGFKVTTALDGEEGLKKVKKQKPDLVILDLMLPKKDGLSVCHDLKSNDSTSRIPIIMLTSLGSGSEGKEGAELLSKGHKAETYLEKPVEPEVLVKKARELTDRPTWPAEKRPKMLIVDDDADFISSLVIFFDEYEYDIIVSYTGEDGLLKAISENPDIIILDVMLPEKDGYAVCKELKEDEKTKGIPVLMLTCVGEKLTKPDYAKVFAETHKADDYIEKPVEMKELKKRIEKLIEPARRLVEV